MSTLADTESLFRAYAAFVASFARRLGVRQGEIDDVVQEVFLVVHGQGGYRPGPAKPRSWLGAITWRIASSRRRSAHRRREVADDSGVRELRSPTAGPAAAAETRQRLELVAEALAALDDEHRVPFILFELEGESCASIANALGVPVGTVHSRLHNARRKFMETYASLARGPSDDSSGEVGA